MESPRLQFLDNYVGSDERIPQGDNDRLLRRLYETTCYQTTDNYDFTPKSCCLGSESNPHFDEREAAKENIRAEIRRYKKLKQLFARTEEIPILQGIDYELLTVGNRPVVIGEGKFGVAFLAKDTRTNKVVTIKLFKKKGNLKTLNILKEVGFQMVINKESESSFSPRLLGLLIFMESKVPPNCHSFMLVMEYLSILPEMAKPMKLSLSDAIKFQKEGCDVLSERNWAGICKQVIEITKELSEMKIAHLDLHAHNLLLVFEQSEVTVKVIDFGTCALLDGNARLIGFDKTKSLLYGKELAALGRPLHTSDLFSVSAHILVIYRKVLKRQDAVNIVDRFRKQPFGSRWNHYQLFSRLKMQ